MIASTTIEVHLKRSLILTSCNLGDGLIFAVLANNLAKHGRRVTLYSPHLVELGAWIPSYTILPIPAFEDLKEKLQECDEIFIEMHDLPIIHRIHSMRKELGSKLRFLCPLGSLFPLESIDYVFNRNRCMVENVLAFVATLGIPPENSIGIVPPKGLHHRGNKSKVAMHALSANVSKNYPLAKFKKIAEKLTQLGYEPVFLAHTKESFTPPDPFSVFTFKNAEELASFLYECGFFIGNDSGPGHLASALNIPGMIVTKSEKKSRLWRPGWKKMEIIYPSNWVPNIRGLRLRDKLWQKLIFPKRILRTFDKVVQESQK